MSAEKLQSLIETLCAEDGDLTAKVLEHCAGDADLAALAASLASKKRKTGAALDRPTDEEFNAEPVRFRFRPEEDASEHKDDLVRGVDDPASDAVRGHILGEKPEGTAIVDFGLMTEFMSDTFEAFGVPAEEADVCADVLIR